MKIDKKLIKELNYLNEFNLRRLVKKIMKIKVSKA